MTDRKCCSDCKTSQPLSNFHQRGGGRTGPLSVCKQCQRFRWNKDTLAKRGGLRGYCRVQRVTGSPQEVAQAVIQMARAMRPESEGVRVYRLPCGEVRFWQGAMRPPRDAEPIGVYDFEAKPEYVAQDLAA